MEKESHEEGKGNSLKITKEGENKQLRRIINETQKYLEKGINFERRENIRLQERKEVIKEKIRQAYEEELRLRAIRSQEKERKREATRKDQER